MTAARPLHAGTTRVVERHLLAGTPFAGPVGADLHFVPSGGTLTLDNLSVGTHKFECFIHPWMRTTIEQRSD